MQASKENDFKADNSEQEEFLNKRAKKLEYLKNYRQKKRESYELLRKEAIKLQSENRELSLKEIEVLRLAKETEDARLKAKEAANQNRKKSRAANLTPEQKKALKLKKLLNAQKLKKQKQELKEERKKYKKTTEYFKQYRQKQRERYELLRKEAVMLESENRELSLKEKQVLKKGQQIEAKRRKKIQALREYRQKKTTLTAPEDKRKQEEAKKILLSNSLKVKSIQEATELLNPNQDPHMSSEEKEIKKIALKIIVARLRNTENKKKRYAALTSEEKEAVKLKACLLRKKRKELEALKPPEERKNYSEYQKQYRQRKREREQLLRKEASKLVNLNRELSLEEKVVLRRANEMEEKRRKSNRSRKFRKPDKRKEKIMESQVYGQESQTASETDFGVNELKIEKEELQETTINAIPARWSSVEPSEKSFTTEERNQTYFRSFNGTSHYQIGTSIDRRKTEVHASLSYMRSLIENMAKGDEFEVFGKLIGQKFRSNNSSVAEVNIAKLLIDSILQNL